MSADQFKPKVYIREGCPYSFKFWLFIVEAGIAKDFEPIVCRPEDPQFDAIKSRLSTGLGRPATFPAVEIEPGRFKADSDQLIAYFAERYGVDAASLPALAFYRGTILPQLEELHRHG